jgi:hypothetical protein
VSTNGIGHHPENIGLKFVLAARKWHFYKPCLRISVITVCTLPVASTLV